MFLQSGGDSSQAPRHQTRARRFSQTATQVEESMEQQLCDLLASQSQTRREHEAALAQVFAHTLLHLQ